MRRSTFLGYLALGLLGALIPKSARAQTPFFTQQDLFTSYQEGYSIFRIPTLIVAPDGTLLAFCEGRSSISDSGYIEIVLKRSSDGGATWSPLQVVASDTPNAIGSPCPVVNPTTGEILLLMTGSYNEDTEYDIANGTARGTARVYISKSSDNGVSWFDYVDITDSTKLKTWGAYATGPGIGIQLNSGRLIIPCHHNVVPNTTNESHLIYSDDQGATWEIGGTLSPYLNESQVVELVDGSVMINMRNDYGVSNNRKIAMSTDGGLNWSNVVSDPTLIEPQCQASILRYSRQDRDGQPNLLLFSNPASTQREKMTVRISYDEGKTWPVSKLIYGGAAAYSCLTVLPDKTIGCLYERGVDGAAPGDAYARITFANFSLDWIMS